MMRQYPYHTDLLTKRLVQRAKSALIRCAPLTGPSITAHQASVNRAPSSPHLLLHAVPQVNQYLIDGVDTNQPETGVFEIEDDKDRHGHDDGEDHHVDVITARLALGQAIPCQQGAGQCQDAE